MSALSVFALLSTLVFARQPHTGQEGENFSPNERNGGRRGRAQNKPHPFFRPSPLGKRGGDTRISKRGGCSAPMILARDESKDPKNMARKLCKRRSRAKLPPLSSMASEHGLQRLGQKSTQFRLPSISLCEMGDSDEPTVSALNLSQDDQHDWTAEMYAPYPHQR